MAAGRRRAMQTLAAGWLGLLLLLTCLRCQPAEPQPEDGPQGQLSLLSPKSPLGLSYGEQALLLLHYQVRGEPQAGVTVRLAILAGGSGSGQVSGATLSSPILVTNDHGDASVLLTAGSAEAAFSVVASSPQAQDLTVDVAVSRYAFGDLGIELDATAVAPQATTLRAGLFPDVGCAQLPLQPKLMGALRSQRLDDRRGLLAFTTLLVRGYTAVGRAEDRNGHLLAYACLELPSSLLRASPPVPLALKPVFPSPVGTFQLTSKLRLPTEKVWTELLCPAGQGQVFLDSLLSAIPVADQDLAKRLAALRWALDPTGCRPTGSIVDTILHTLLTTTSAGTALKETAADVATIQSSVQVDSVLQVQGEADQGPYVGAHSLTALSLKTARGSATYLLHDVRIQQARELVIGRQRTELQLPAHELTLQLPRFWRRAISELALQPRTITVTLPQLLQASVVTAKSGMATGCEAVEQLLCSRVAAPCKGALIAPCQQAISAAMARLEQSLADLPSGSGADLSMGATATLFDPDGSLHAAELLDGKLSGSVLLPEGRAALVGTLSGLSVTP